MFEDVQPKENAMSNPAASPQHEPTMEEILASIRKIISDDQPESGKPAAQPTQLRAVESGLASAAESDVLELTEEVEEEAPAAPAPKLAPPPVLVAALKPAMVDDIAFETVEESPKAEERPKREAVPKSEEHPAQLGTDDLISNSTRTLVSRAFADIDKKPAEYSTPTAGALDALFAKAIQSAFQPTLTEWVDGHNTEIMETLKPLVRAWMDEHLPALVEAALAREFARAAGRKR
jgi:cell pole-organizing protein PopZ